MSAPTVSRGRLDGEPGEFSTVELPDGSIATYFFPDDRHLQPHVIGRYHPRLIHSAHLDAATKMTGIYT